MKQQKPITPDKALDRLSGLCAQSECCSKDLDDKMKRWGLSEADRRQVLKRLVEEGFVDDRRYAEAFVADKLRFNQWGRMKIEMGLRQKGIAPDVASEVLDAVPDEDYIDVLHPLLKQKYKTIKAETDYERSMKLLRFAAGRGFPLDIIRRCIDLNPDITADES